MAASDKEPRNSSTSEQGTPAARQADVGPHESQNSNELHGFSDISGSEDRHGLDNLDFLLDIPLDITVELGRTRMLIQDLLKLGQGSVIELSKQAGDTLEILANSRLIARGDVVMANEKYGIRLTEMISPVARHEKTK